MNHSGLERFAQGMEPTRDGKGKLREGRPRVLGPFMTNGAFWAGGPCRPS